MNDKASLPPGPRPFEYWRRYQEFPPGVLHAIVSRFGDVVRWQTVMTVYVLNHPEDVKRVLSQSYPQFTKHTLDYRILAQIMGNGLVSNDGPDWVRQRRLMQPLFNNRQVNSFDGIINRLTGGLLDTWDRRRGEEPVWLDREMGRLTFQIVGATLFGTDIDAHAAEIAEILEVVNIHTHQLSALLTLWPWLPTPHNRRFNVAKRRLDQIVYGLINARRASGVQHGDLLQLLLSARDEDTQQGMSETQMRDEIITLMLAGHETSATGLVWTFYLLANNPVVEERLLAELLTAVGDRPPDSADLARLPYLKQVVQESMRIYPPVWAIARRTREDEVFQGYRVPGNAYVVMMPYTLHRHPEFWPDPLRFDPDRFDPNRETSRHSYAYLPFAAGPRTCIGASMAMLEMQLVLAQILQRYRVTPVPGHPVEPIAKVTLKTRYGLPVTLTRR